MNKTIASFIILFGFSAQASVWDQMQTNGLQRVTGKVTAIEFQGTGTLNLSLQVAGEGGAKVTRSFQASTGTMNGACNNSYHSDEERVAFFTQRVELLREAFKNDDVIELSFSGPWNPWRKIPTNVEFPVRVNCFSLIGHTELAVVSKQVLKPVTKSQAFMTQ